MKLLVIGGSYFLGRVFTMIASNTHELTLINRGRYSMEQFNVEQFHFDRHDILQWQQLEAKDYDAIIDFCAYLPNDISTVINNFKGKFKKYILISTVDVYQRQTHELKNERHPLENRQLDGEVGEYITNKIKLEQELIAHCNQNNIDYAIIRPGLIYGPFNYAPRESAFIQLIINNMPLVKLSDANGQFQMVYVKDVAMAILAVCSSTKQHAIYNVINNEILDYDKLYSIFEQVSPQPINYTTLTISDAMKYNYPTPFPVTIQETELYDGLKITNECDFKYTSLKEGMQKTFDAFIPVFQTK